MKKPGPGVPEPTARAKAIVDGLIRTGRATHPMLFHGFIRLVGINGDHYYVAFSGDQVLRGDTLKDADELQPGFVAAMERAGAGAQHPSI